MIFRRILPALALLASVSASVFVYPGHSYLAGETQTLAPMLVRLRQPGMLTRDLVAIHPNLTYTVYDEVTLSMSTWLQGSLESALLVQQIIFRICLACGIYLLAQAAGARKWAAVGAAALFQVGFCVLGPALAVVDREPTPTGFALGAIVLTVGLFACDRPVKGSLAGGVAVIYDPRIAAPFWVLLLIAAAVDRRMRGPVCVALPTIAVFCLLLANAAQLQPGAPESRPVFEHVAAAIAGIEAFRTPQIFVSHWSTGAFLWIAALALACLWSLREIWPNLNRSSRWLFAGLPTAGFLSVLISKFFVDKVHWAAGAELHPGRMLVFAAVIVFAAACAIWAQRWRSPAAIGAAAVILLLMVPGRPRRAVTPQVGLMAQWAESSTWGASMFAFPDAGRGLEPGAFRAISKRPVWVDWQTGDLADYSDAFADEWYRRWQDTMAPPYTPERLPALLSLPIDYCVLHREHALKSAQPVFSDAQFVVYDADTLRKLKLIN